MNKSFALLLSSVLCAGCAGGTDEPTERNFRAAILDELAENNPYCAHFGWLVRDDTQRANFQVALEAEGFMQVRPGFFSNEYAILEKGEGVVSILPSRHYTENGRGYRVPGDHSDAPFACAAEGADLVSISPKPTEEGAWGVQLVEVSYRYKPTEVSPWVSATVKPYLEPFLVEKEGSITLILTENDGWRKDGTAAPRMRVPPN